ncbi:MAG TPA: S8 family serine peptidase [Ignavibacteriaceae bacterium]|nr:S8 family serine peptidase [Ignavibacteriaceae bacterium]
MKNLLLIVFVIIFSSVNFSQDKYLIYFKDKGIEPGKNLNKSSLLYKQALNNLTERAIERRKKTMGDEIITYEDIPLREDYLNELESRGIKIVHKLTWFNAVSAYLTNDQLIELKNSSFIKKIDGVKKFKGKKDESFEINQRNEIPSNNLKKLNYNPAYDYGESFGQLELCDIPIVHSKGITGEGVILGLLDTGFDWNDHEALVNVNVIDEYDFIFADTITADESEDSPGQHNHGTSVMSEVAGYLDGTLIGASFGSSFLLAKTEYVPSETHVEEDNYAAALIWMENKGVDITSSSLGYSEFDPGQTSYTYQDMDGQTTIVTIACELAFSRGVVTITSAGNEGANAWHFITAPADGFNTIAIGAVNSNNEVTSFSSRGPTSDGRIKPDILTQGSGVFAASASGFTNYNPGFGGTSAAAPLACGIAGLLLSAHPHLNNIQVREILQKTSDNYNTPNNDRGYGLASAQNAINFPNIEAVSSTFKMHKYFISNVAVNPSTVKLNYSINGGNFQQVDMTFEGSIKYNYLFSDLTNNQQLLFYFTYSDSSGTNYREPATGNYGQLVLDSEVVSNVPVDFVLRQNYPNPFNNQTKIEFDSPGNQTVELIIYNALGQKVKELFSGVPQIGKNTLFWNGTDQFGKSVSSGIYFYNLKSQDRFVSKKMVLVK